MNILIADGELFAEGLAEALRLHNFGEPLYLETANSANETLELLQPEYNIEFDLLVLDLNLSKGSANWLLKQLQQHHCHLPVLLTSSTDLKNEILPAVKSGVMGYVEKSSKPDEIIYAIQQVLSGQPYFSFPVLSDNKIVETKSD